MPELCLLTSSDDSYLHAVTAAIEGAERVTLVVAFASPRGVELLAPSLEKLLSKPKASARLVLGIDRQGFNTVDVFQTLLSLEEKYGARFELGVVPEQGGILHAKAMLAEGPAGSELLVGSANLTKSALHTNHELTLHVRDVPAHIRGIFNTFLRSLHPAPLNQKTKDGILQSLGGIRTPSPPRPSTSGAWSALIASLQAAPLTQPPDEFINGWIARGYLVGRGRRTADALSIRLPLDALSERHLIKAVRRRSIGEAARESRTLGYSIELLPVEVAANVRKVARRIVALPARLGLQLPCFGLWMPESLWPVFEEARARLLRSNSLDETSLLHEATRQRKYLLEDGGLEKELENVMAQLTAEASLLPGDEADVRKTLQEFLIAQLTHRTPEVLVQAVEFRTGRQRWAPFEKTETPYRQLLVDIVQAAFSSTYRTGRWPTHIRSYAVRELVGHVEKALRSVNGTTDSAAAVDLLTFAETWEQASRPFAEIVGEFRRFIPDDVSFSSPDVNDLISEIGEPHGEDDDDI